MRFIGIVVAAFLVLAPAAARADIVVISDPDKWIEGAMTNIAEGRTQEFARDFLKLIDKPDNFDSFHGNLAVLGRIGKPVFFEKVSDERYGNVLRQVTYVALYRQVDYMYFRFIVKKNRNGFAITNFEFKNEAGDLFPAGFLVPR
jgi:hypothetical protein